MVRPEREPRTPKPPGAVRWIVRTLEEEGFDTWAVGGAVRDALLGIHGGDWDLATRARPGDVQRIFPRTVPIGIDHGTVGVLDRAGDLYEVTTFRRDVETFGRRARVRFAESVDEDLGRRDFTVNALAWHPLRDELRDPFDGLEDLERGVLRTVGEPRERFAEDYLRVLRALRFSGRFSFRIEPGTWTALCDSVERLHRLSAERIREELMKILGGEEPPSRGLGLYAASGAVAELYPELEAMVESPRREQPREGMWEHALLTADVLPAHRPTLRLAALFDQVGGPDAVSGHDDSGKPERERAARRTAAVLARLRFSNARTDRVVSLVEAGSEPPGPDAGGAQLRRWLSWHGPELLPDRTRIWLASARVDRARGTMEPAHRVVGAWRSLRSELQASPPLGEADLALDGRDLIRMGLKPGPRFGRILAHLLDRVLEDPGRNDPETLETMVEAYLAEHGEERDGDGTGGPDAWGPGAGEAAESR